MTVTIHIGDAREVLETLPNASVQTCVTSPPYFNLRDYGVAGQIGLEPTPDEYVAEIAALFRQVRRVLRDDGTLWLNLGDSYAGGGNGGGGSFAIYAVRGAKLHAGKNVAGRVGRRGSGDGAKPKDLLGIPWMVAFALRADGWYLRSEIIWSKPNPMPESVRDRPTCAHEHIFLLSKRSRYFYDSDAIRQPLAETSYQRLRQDIESQGGSTRANGGTKSNGPMKAVRFGGNKGCGDQGSASRTASGNNWNPNTQTANARNVWVINTQPFSGAHFATMPPELAAKCIKAGSRRGDVVLDPFGGAGTTGLAADRLGRDAVLIELNPEYAEIARQRIAAEAGLFARVV